MRQIFLFFSKNKDFLFFLLLLSISMWFTISSHTYHKSKFVNSANYFAGNLFLMSNDIHEYFGLKKENDILSKENRYLKELLFNHKNGVAELQDSLLNKNYTIISAKVINNSYQNKDNYLTISAGRKAGVKREMGVITSNGILGIVDEVSTNFSTVFSILNSKSRINARLKNSYHFGSLVWNQKNPNIVQLIDVPRIAPIRIGDTIVTGGKSSIFPDGIPIGIVKNFEVNTFSNYFSIDILLFNDMTNLNNAFILKNNLRKEILELESKVNEK
ncbi:MAG: rod shape-determining protein MreC [Flavobacteriales bacterium CG_4_9_14_3_um_filter_40_17]|nr:MAG: rod shape-determining protein MreC [Flavobacteriales bacterium CG_4_9_14_3_um_filter_40_17]